MGRNQGLKIHEVLGKGSSFIETAEADIPSDYHFIFLNTKNIFLFQFVYGMDDSKSHADR